MTQSKIKKAEPLMLKAKSINGIDRSFKNIEALYTDSHNKVQKKLSKELIALKVKPPESVDQARVELIQSTLLKYT